MSSIPFSSQRAVILSRYFHAFSPEVAVFNVLSLQYDQSQREAYNRMTLEGMEWSLPNRESFSAPDRFMCKPPS